MPRIHPFDLAERPEIHEAAAASWAASKATWADPANPTAEEEIAAKQARLNAMKAKRKELEEAP